MKVLKDGVVLKSSGGLETDSTFTEKRRGLEVRNKYLEKFNNK